MIKKFNPKSNFGDAKTNSRLTSQLELRERYNRCLKLITPYAHGYCVINNSPFLESESLRVGTNIFGENPSIAPFPIFFTDEK